MKKLIISTLISGLVLGGLSINSSADAKKDKEKQKFSNQSKKPPGLQKKPNGMPPGQYKKQNNNYSPSPSPYPGSSTQLNVPFQLGFGQTAFIQSENLSVTFTKVFEDSRCPYDVQCIQAGRFTAQINVRRNGSNLGTYNLSLDPRNTALATQRVGIYTITLNRVYPESISSTNRPPYSSYSINLTVSR